MNNIIVKITAFIFLLTTSSCIGESSRVLHKRWMENNVNFVKHPNYEGKRSSDPFAKYLKGFNANPSAPQGEAGCALTKIGQWKRANPYKEYTFNYWVIDKSWNELNSSMTNESGDTVDSRTENSSAYIVKRIAENPGRSSIIYIGPWKYVPHIGKEIRLVAGQSVKYGSIRSFFESKTRKNAKIPEMPEIKLARYPESNLDYCKVLWMKTHGYNAVIDVRKNPKWPWFSRDYYLGTGKIIEARE